jgi:hypothetical protein
MSYAKNGHGSMTYHQELPLPPLTDLDKRCTAHPRCARA